MNKLEELRNEINSVDSEIVKLFIKRMEAVKGVIEYKLKNGLDILDLKREEEIIKRNVALLNNKELEEYYIEVFKSFMRVSKEYQAKLREENK